MKHMKASLALLFLFMVSACKQEQGEIKKSQPIIFREDESDCVKEQRYDLEQLLPAPNKTVEEVLRFLLDNDNAKKVPVCTKGV